RIPQREPALRRAVGLGDRQDLFHSAARYGDGDRRPFRRRQVDLDPPAATLLRADLGRGAARWPAADGLQTQRSAQSDRPGRAARDAVRRYRPANIAYGQEGI